jgi:glycosyltransferase involved in cell wall biosynthesis
MKIAIIGTRGVPARYGGFETCAEELSVGLVNKGHKVIVTCRKYLYPEKVKCYKGVKLIHLPSIRGKFTDTFSHTFLSILRVLFESPDIILIFNSANSPFAIIGKISGKKIVINVDGLEWKRKKWNIIGKIYFKFCEILSCIFADTIVSDSKEIKKYYKRKYGKETIYIPYGSYFYESKKPEILEKYGVKKKEYFLIASRLEPENNQDLIIEAFKKIETEKKLLILGNLNKKSKYINKLLRLKNGKIEMPGSIYEKEFVCEIFSNAFAYIHGNEVGGTNPALLKAMGSGNCIISFDVPFNREVLGDCGFYFKDVNELKEKIEYLLKNPEVVERYGKMARERAEKLYRWEKVIDDYENLFFKILK